MTSLRAALAGSVLALGAFAASATGVTPVRVVSDCVGAGTNHAAVVVEHGDGRVVSACVAFASATISGLDLLRQSGIEYATSSYAGLGDAICQLDGEPATYPAGCWSSSSPYWVLFVARTAGQWSVAPVGMSSLTFSNGDAEGFRYQPQTGAAQPPSAPGRCPAAPGGPTPTPPATPAATHTTRPTPTPRAAGPTPRPAAATPAASSLVASGSAEPAPTPAQGSSGPPGDTASPSTVTASPIASSSGSTGASTAPLGVAPSPSLDPGTADASPAGLATWLGALAAVVVLLAFALVAALSRARGRQPRGPRG